MAVGPPRDQRTRLGDREDEAAGAKTPFSETKHADTGGRTGECDFSGRVGNSENWTLQRENAKRIRVKKKKIQGRSNEAKDLKESETRLEVKIADSKD